MNWWGKIIFFDPTPNPSPLRKEGLAKLSLLSLESVERPRLTIMSSPEFTTRRNKAKGAKPLLAGRGGARGGV